MAYRRGTVSERFHRSYAIHVLSGCWNWKGTRNPRYGKMRVGDKMVGAHRVSYELHKGPIPSSQNVLHECDNPACVNPDHLFLGTQKDNSDDKFSKGRGMEGNRHRNRKIDAATAGLIRNAGGTQQWLADWFGISRSQVSRIKSGANWRTSEEANARSERKL